MAAARPTHTDGARARGAAPPSASVGDPPSGLAGSLRGLLANLVNATRTRGELLQVELEEEKLRVAGIAVFALAAAFFMALSVLVLTFFLILLFWDGNRVLVSGLIGAAYLVIGVVLALIARSRAGMKSKLFSASLAELKKDGEALKQ